MAVTAVKMLKEGQRGWEVAYVGLTLPFRNLMLGMICLLIAGAVGVGFAVLSGAITMPLYWILAKRGCQEEPVKAALVSATPRRLRLTFENVKYATEFAKANGGEPAATPPSGTAGSGPSLRGLRRDRGTQEGSTAPRPPRVNSLAGINATRWSSPDGQF